MNWITGTRSYSAQAKHHPRGLSATKPEQRRTMAQGYDDEFPVSPQEIELIRRDTIQAERDRRMKPRNFANDYR